MSDFLSKFEQPVQKKSAHSPGAFEEPERLAQAGSVPPQQHTKGRHRRAAGQAQESLTARTQQLPALEYERTSSELQRLPLHGDTTAGRARIAPVEHETSFDDGYKRRRTIRLVLILLAVALLGVAGFFVYTNSQQVTVPDFVGKPLTEAQAWARENNLELVVTNEHSIQMADGLIMTQELNAGSSTTRGSKLALCVSSGPNPDELLSLPDFSQLNLEEARAWIGENKATNLRIVQEFSETVPQDAFIKLVFRADTTTLENYTRKDYASLYYSKGPEVFEKNIEVPDFKGKSRLEVESWANTNSITLEVDEEASASVAMGSVISQSIAAKEKVAKKDTLRIVVSLGKATVVPNYANYNAQTAASAAPGLMVNIKTEFSLKVPYGELISQSVGAGTGVLPTQDIVVTVVYSEGQPYLKNYRGINEGELASLFWLDYASKGADVSYSVEYVDSSEERGTVVAMSSYNIYIPMAYHVEIYVSNGSLPAPAPSPAPTPAPVTTLAPTTAPDQ